MRVGRDPSRSKRYSAIKTRIFIADLLLMVVSLAVFQVFISRPLSRGITGSFGNFYLSCFFFSFFLMVYLYAVSFPLRIAGAFFLERAFGLSRQTLGAWFSDEAKSFFLSTALSLACVQVFYLLLRNFPVFWWLIAGTAWALFSAALASLFPVLIIPLFFKYLPIGNAELKDRIMGLARRTGIDLTDVCRIDLSRKTSKANAALVGLGKTRKVILADTLTDNFTLDEVIVVVAHEFAHFLHRHMWKLIAFGGVVTLAGFFLLFLAAPALVDITGSSGITDLYLLPLFMLLAVLGGIILLPARNLYSRALERQADRYALSATEDAENFISMMNKLAAMNLADTDPSPVKKVFIYDHPPVGERIRMAEAFRDSGKHGKWGSELGAGG